MKNKYLQPSVTIVYTTPTNVLLMGSWENDRDGFADDLIQ